MKSRFAGIAAGGVLSAILLVGSAWAGGDELRKDEDAADTSLKGATTSIERGVRVTRPAPERDRIYYDRGPGYFVPQYDAGAAGGGGVTEVNTIAEGGLGLGGSGGIARATGGNSKSNASNVNTNSATSTSKNDISNTNTNTNTNKNSNSNTNTNSNKNQNTSKHFKSAKTDTTGHNGGYGGKTGTSGGPKVTYLAGGGYGNSGSGTTLHGPAGSGGSYRGSTGGSSRGTSGRMGLGMGSTGKMSTGKMGSSVHSNSGHSAMKTGGRVAGMRGGRHR